MAKRKSAAALFEVIMKGKPVTASPRRGIGEAVRDWLAAWIPRRASAVYRTQERSGGAPTEPLPAPHAAMVLDPERREVGLRFSYTAGIIGGFALATVVAAAFLLGQKTGQAPLKTLFSPSTEQIRNMPPQQGLTDIGSSDEPTAWIDGLTAGTQTDPSPAARRAPANRVRTPKFNYVVIQSYPDQKMATDAAKLMVDNGIDCTVEKELPEYSRPGMYSVVGVLGFERISSQQYKAYAKKVGEVSDRVLKKGASSPLPYQWRATASASAK